MEYGSGVLGFLAGVTARSLCLAALAWLAMALFRVRSSATRHALWTAVAAGMLLLAALGAALPAVPLRVLRPVRATPSAAPVHTASVSTMALPPAAPQASPVPGASFLWEQVAMALYCFGVLALLGRLAFGYRFTRRLTAASRLVKRSRPADVYSSTWIAVPLTVGWRNPKILLPAGYREWSRDKLDAVLAHEWTHVRRGDWAIALMAGLNRSVFWFHPLAWWIERRLAALAEEACDDAALLDLGSREPYAQVLLDMAAAVRTGHGRLVKEAIAMARVADVRKRIERILDDTRPVPVTMTRWGRAGLAMGSLAVIWLASVVQLAPAQVDSNYLSPQAVTALEQTLAANPEDMAVRGRLISHYYLAGVRQPRLDHVFWLIQFHPESDLTGFQAAGVLPRSTALNSTADYERAASLWRAQVVAHANDGRVLQNAAQFFAQPGGNYEEAERLLQQAAAAPAPSGTAMDKLAKLYANAIATAAGYPRFDATAANAAFGEHARTVLENSTDPGLFIPAVSALSVSSLCPGMSRDAALARYPQLTPVVEFGERLQARAQQAGIVHQAPSVAPMPRPATLPPVGATLPRVISRVPPVYPQLAREEKIQGIVALMATIGADGHVKDATTVRGHPLLIAPAIEAVKQWVFAPALQNGAPVEIRTQVEVSFSLPDQANVAPAQPPITRIRVGGNVQGAMLTQRVDPVYPDQARESGIEGDVLLSITIGNDGHVLSIQAMSGHPLLAAAAQEAVRQWIYKPTLLNGNPVEVSTTVMVRFRLDGSIPETQVVPPVAFAPGAPRVTSRAEPEYTEEARKAKLQGTVTLAVHVGTDGNATNIRVLKSLGMGLDEKAIEAVKKWHFQPASREGQPVEMDATIEINFRLL